VAESRRWLRLFLMSLIATVPLFVFGMIGPLIPGFEAAIAVPIAPVGLREWGGRSGVEGYAAFPPRSVMSCLADHRALASTARSRFGVQKGQRTHKSDEAAVNTRALLCITPHGTHSGIRGRDVWVRPIPTSMGDGTRPSAASAVTARAPSRLLFLPFSLPAQGLMLDTLLMFVLSTLVQFVLGAPFYRRAWKALRARTANMDVLVALGTTCAWLFSVVSTVATLINPALPGPRDAKGSRKGWGEEEREGEGQGKERSQGINMES